MDTVTHDECDDGEMEGSYAEQGKPNSAGTRKHLQSERKGVWEGHGECSRQREEHASRTRVEISTEGSSEWCIEVSGSVVSNSCDPMDCGPPGFSVHRISQARIMEWVTISSSRGSS